MQRGTRVFDGAHYLMCGRGTKESMQREKKYLLREWKRVRIVRMGPIGDILDDYACYVFERRTERERAEYTESHRGY